MQANFILRHHFFKIYLLSFLKDFQVYPRKFIFALHTTENSANLVEKLATRYITLHNKSCIIGCSSDTQQPNENNMIFDCKYLCSHHAEIYYENINSQVLLFSICH